MKLSERFTQCGSDKNTIHSYGEFYDDLSSRLPANPTILEIGVYEGHSLKALMDHFPSGRIIGVDKDIRPRYRRRRGLEVLQCTTPDYAPLIVQMKRLGLRFDVIIDDGSHHLADQSQGVICLSQFLSDSGIYIIEDLQNEEAIERFQNMSFRVIDLRHVKGRVDDILAVASSHKCSSI